MSRASQSLRTAVLRRDKVPEAEWHSYECHHLIPKRLLPGNKIYNSFYCKAIPASLHKTIHANEARLREIAAIPDPAVRCDAYRGFLEELANQ